jgi:hypothetical protein
VGKRSSLEPRSLLGSREEPRRSRTGTGRLHGSLGRLHPHSWRPAAGDLCDAGPGVDRYARTTGQQRTSSCDGSRTFSAAARRPSLARSLEICEWSYGSGTTSDQSPSPLIDHIAANMNQKVSRLPKEVTRMNGRMCLAVQKERSALASRILARNAGYSATGGRTFARPVTPSGHPAPVILAGPRNLRIELRDR